MYEVYAESIEQENVTISSMADFENSTRTNRTNRLEVLEEYYGNSTNDDQPEITTAAAAVEFKEMVVLSANASINEDTNRTNVTVVEEISKREREKKGI